MPLSRREFLASACGLPALLAYRDAEASTPPARYALVGTVFTGSETRPKSQHAVVVNQNRIEAVLPATSLPDSTNFPLIPANFIMPGVINCHTHRIHHCSERRQRHLFHGVTSIGDTASPVSALHSLLHSDPLPTADAACSGPMFCPPGGYPLPVHSPDHGMVVTSPSQARECVRKLSDLGTTMIKLAFEPGPYPVPWPLLEAPVAEAICDEARRIGLTIRCHVEDFGGLQATLDAGVNTVEHVPHRWIRDGRPQTILEGPEDAPVPITEYRELLERMKREGVILTPTLDVLSRSMWNGPELYAPVRYFAEIGGKIAVGNDHPYRRTEAGMPVQEMRLLQKAGVEAPSILQGSTSTGATACGFRDRGELSPGMRADILVLDADPAEDLTAMESPAFVIKDGVFVKRD